MKMKQLAAILLAGILTVGAAPCAVYAEEASIEENSVDASLDTAEDTSQIQDSAEPEATVTDSTVTDSTITDSTVTDSTVAETPAAETPAAETSAAETPVTESAQEPAAYSERTPDGTVAKIGETEYKTIQDAIAAAPSYTETTIELIADVSLADTAEIPADKIITLTSDSEVRIERSEADNAVFSGDMFSVSGTLILTGSITAFGDLSEENKASGCIVNIPEGSSGVFQMEDAVTLMGNAADTSALTDGSAVVNSSVSGRVNLYGGYVNDNSGVDGCGVYSVGKVYVKGSPYVNDNTGSGDSESSPNLLLDGESAALVVEGSFDGSIYMSLKNQTKGAAAVLKDEGVTDDVFAAALNNITYESEFYQLDTDGTLKAVPFLITDNASGQWIDHSSASVTFSTFQNCKYNVTYVPETASDEDILAVGFDETAAKALAKDQTVTETVGSLPDEDVLILVIAKADEADVTCRAVFSIEGDRPAAGTATSTPSPIPTNSPTPTSSPTPTDTPTPTPTVTTRAPYTPGVDETVVTGFENPLDFTTANVSYTFSVTGAGTQYRDSAVAGDVMWEPLYFSTVANPTDSQKIYPSNGVWSIAIKNGGVITESKTIPVYIWCRKYEYDGSEWVNQKRIEAKVTSFQTLSASEAGTTETTTGDSTTDSDSDALTFGSESSTTSAVSTADNTQIGTFIAMAIISLAGIFTALKMRKAKQHD